MVDPLMGGTWATPDPQAETKVSNNVYRCDATTPILARKLADTVVFLQDGRVSFLRAWKDFESSTDPFLHNFLEQDA